MGNKIGVIVVLMVALVGNALADKPEIIQLYENEKMTMLDMGIFRLGKMAGDRAELAENMVKYIHPKVVGKSPYINYNKESNKIEIVLNVFQNVDDPKLGQPLFIPFESEEKAKMVLDAFSEFSFMMVMNSNENTRQASRNVVEGCFLHRVYFYPIPENQFNGDILDLIVLEFKTEFFNGNWEKEKLVGKRGLLSEGLEYSIE